MKTKLNSNLLTACVLVVSLTIASTAGLTSTASAAQFQWTWSVEGYVVEGAFSTSVTSGLIDETDVTAHEFTVSQSGSSLFTVDLVGGTLNGVALTEDDELAHDFEYVIGSTSFESVNSDPGDENVPVSFTAYIEESDLDHGLGYVTDASPISWQLWPGDFNLEVTEGFGSGPVITVVPEPSSLVCVVLALMMGRRR